jgi:hypothetical protein
MLSPCLHIYAYKGCPVAQGKPWTYEQIEAALICGPQYKSTNDTTTAKLWKEAQDKSAQDITHIIPWASIKDDVPTTLK